SSSANALTDALQELPGSCIPSKAVKPAGWNTIGAEASNVPFTGAPTYAESGASLAGPARSPHSTDRAVASSHATHAGRLDTSSLEMHAPRRFALNQLRTVQWLVRRAKSS